MNIEDNLWYQNGYRVGDVLVGRSVRSTIVFREIKGYDNEVEYIRTKDIGVSSFNCSRVAWASTWKSEKFKFKAQDYIEDIQNPTKTEISLISLQFPEIDIEEFLKQIKQLTKEDK